MRGHQLAVPPGTSTRPTSDRAREGLFSALGSMLRPGSPAGLAGARVLDLYAGSGAVGLEALSRGAATARMVEKDRRAAATAKTNAQALAFLSAGAVVTAMAVEVLVKQRCPEAPYDVAFLDPPYAVDAAAVRAVLAALTSNGWLSARAVVVVERSARDSDWQWPDGFVPERSRRYGEAMLWYGRAAGRRGDLQGDGEE